MYSVNSARTLLFQVARDNDDIDAVAVRSIIFGAGCGFDLFPIVAVEQRQVNGVQTIRQPTLFEPERGDMHGDVRPWSSIGNRT